MLPPTNCWRMQITGLLQAMFLYSRCWKWPRIPRPALRWVRGLRSPRPTNTAIWARSGGNVEVFNGSVAGGCSAYRSILSPGPSTTLSATGKLPSVPIQNRWRVDSTMGIIGVIVCLAFFFLFLFDFSQRLPAVQRPKFRRWCMGWTVKGLLAPTAVWVLFDGGIFDCFPTFMPQVQFAKLAGNGFGALCDVVTSGCS